jgi:RNA recognition motif-containing protein
MLIYIWNLSPHVSEDDFRQTFETFGHVSSANISSTILKDSGQLLRFALVEMPDQTEAQAAIKNLNRKYLYGQHMMVYKSSEI